MKRHYDIDKSFGVFRRFSPPFGRGTWALARLLLAVAPRPRCGRDLRVRAVRIPGEERAVPAFWIEPKEAGSDAPCLVYFHGGGFVFGAAGYHWRNAFAYAAEAGCKVLFVDYRLAPAHPFPAPNEDCFTAYRWVTEQAETEKIDPGRIAVGGDSAGGCLAADVVRLAADRGVAAPCFLFLIYPVLDRRMQTASMQAFGDTPMWNARLNARMWSCFLAGKTWLSPGEAPGFRCPPTYLETAEFDCLCDEGLAFAAALRSAGIPVILRQTRGTMHGFDIVQKSPITRESLRLRCEALRQAFGERSGRPADEMPPV